MTITFFGKQISASSRTGKLLLVGAFVLVAALMVYTCYLGTCAIGAELHVHPALVFLVLFALTVELTFNERKVSLLPGKHTRNVLSWACAALSLYHYVRLDMRFEAVAVSGSLIVILVSRVVKLIYDNREKQWQLNRAMQMEMADRKYGSRFNK